jgi:hypothetical protein
MELRPRLSSTGWQGFKSACNPSAEAQNRDTVGEHEDQFYLTRAAFGMGGCAKSTFLPVERKQ